MKLATVRYQKQTLSGVVKDGQFWAFAALNAALPDNMSAFIEGYADYKTLVEQALPATAATCRLEQAELLAPLPNPKSLRDFLGFEEHAKNSGKRFGISTESIMETWAKTPAFYYGNPAVHGADFVLPVHPASKMFDFEFEIAAILGKSGQNFSLEQAQDAIFGFTIFNDWSVRDIQIEEMKMGMGSPKGKDYANTIGPVIVTKDELDAYLVPNDPYRYNLATRLTKNGKLLRENNLNSMYHSFAAMIAYASQHTPMQAGELIGSGTIGGGALIEYPMEEGWVQAGDVIEMTVEHIGTLVCKTC